MIDLIGLFGSRYTTFLKLPIVFQYQERAQDSMFPIVIGYTKLCMSAASGVLKSLYIQELVASIMLPVVFNIA